ncbi:MAG: carboxypeptidase-like regulatory domain-containing protein [Terriglobia bacterium]
MFKVTLAKVKCGLLLLACFTLAGSGLLFAQGSGTITGFVTDPAGLAVPGAPVTITNMATGASVKTTTNNAGVYQVRALNAGSYTIEVSASGFQTYVDKNVTLTTNQTLGIDVKLQVGEQKQTITVESAAPLVNTEEGRVQNVVTGSEVNNLPLNGRDIYALMQLAPGAVDSTGIDKEAGTGGLQTNINGARANFNGFMLDGVSNKGLSGGSNDQPAPDFVQEYVIQSNNFSAEYSSSAGSITDVTTKSGTNQFHGDLWEFFRNDKLNARNFFDGNTKSEWRQNQFGGTIGGPIKKDKLFFFGGYEGERFRTAIPSQFFVESPAFHQAVISAMPNSVAALLYKNFPGPAPVSGLETVSDYIGNGPDTGSISGYTDPCFMSNNQGVGTPAAGGTFWGNPQTVANNLAKVLGVTASENLATTADIAANCPGMGFTAPAVQAGTIARDAVMAGFVNSGGSSRTKGVFYDGNKYTAKGDYSGETNRMSARWSFSKNSDPNPTPTTGIRGFSNPFVGSTTGAAYSFVHTFSPTIVNEFRAGYTRSRISDIPLKSQYGVPNIGFDTGEPSFGSYNGYPQIFTEDVFDFKDLVSIVKGKHSIKVGGELKKNYENSEFNVGRPSYYFFDQLYFAADLPYFQSAGVNPELTSGLPSHIDTNIRAWRNYEAGWFVQDDWKVSKRLTLNLGLRWDFFSPHTEKYNKATQLILGPGLASINCEAQVNGKCALPTGDTQTPNGGFAAASQLFPARYGNFAPRIGFAWDPFGNGTTALRGAAAISYEGTFYNALSNSRWNLPYYSFNEACPICGLAALPSYGPIDASGNPTGAAPTYTGPPTSIGNGPAGLGFQGNIMGWLPTNPDLAALTGIPSHDYKLPYVEQFFLGVQHQFGSSTVLEVNGVLNLSRHLFWAENPNRVVNGRARGAITNPCTGASVTTPLINPCFGTMRTWETSVNSSYSGLQVSLNHKASHGLTFITNYTWSHSLDYRSTWHALTSAGSATDSNPYGEAGYSMDPNRLYLEHGNSLFDITHRLVAAASWDLPWMKSQNTLVSKVLGGWQANPDLSLQSGFPFTVGAHTDYNGDGIRSDRPNAPSFGNSKPFTHQQFEDNALAQYGNCGQCLHSFPKPAPGTDGTLGRNTFRGPGISEVDFSLFKKIPINERFSMQFRTEVFNLFNHANLAPPVANLSSSSFGKVQSAADPREIQFGLKLFF